ncbi:MAG: hypothetical protein RSC26_07125 [Terrisporobacter sp.]
MNTNNKYKTDKLKYFRYIILIVVAIFLIKGFYKSYTSSLIYDQSANVISQEQKDTNYFLYNTSEKINNTKINENFILLSGTITLCEITTTNNINLNTSVKTGNLKVMILNNNDDVILFEKLEDGSIDIDINPGTYKIIAIGKWFTGRLYVSTK